MKVSDEESSEWFADLDYNDEGKLLITKSVRSVVVCRCFRLPES